MLPMERKFCCCLTEFMLQNCFGNRQQMADALGLELSEMNGMDISDLAARLFAHCVAHHIHLDEVLEQMAQ